MFCRKCGTQIPEDSMFCIKCGAAVVTSPSPPMAVLVTPSPLAEYIEVFQNVVAKDHFDLYVARTRFVLLRVQSGAGGVGGLLGPVGPIIELGVSRAMRKKHDDDLTLDQRLRRDKKSMAMDYEIVDSVKLGKGKLGGRVMQVRYAGEKGDFKKIDITVNDSQYEKLAELLPTIPGLGPKFQLKA